MHNSFVPVHTYIDANIWRTHTHIYTPPREATCKCSIFLKKVNSSTSIQTKGILCWGLGNWIYWRCQHGRLGADATRWSSSRWWAINSLLAPLVTEERLGCVPQNRPSVLWSIFTLSPRVVTHRGLAGYKCSSCSRNISERGVQGDFRKKERFWFFQWCNANFLPMQSFCLFSKVSK